MKIIIPFMVMLLLFSVNSIAYQLKERSLREYFDGSVKVAKIKVVKSELSVKDGYDCGADYSVNVITAFKGGDSSFVFRSFSKLVVGNEYLIFANTENLDARSNYLSMGKNDVSGYEACTEKGSLYASGFHGEVFEFDLLWQAMTDKAAVKATVKVPYLLKLETEKVEFKSENVSGVYLEALSYWRVCWSSFKKELVALSK